jgi:acetyl-CoA carboxylase biotin carboxyl carrier protein
MDKPVRADEIEALVADFEASGCTELYVRFEGFELHLSADPAIQPIARRTAVPVSHAGQAPAHPPQPASSLPSGPTGTDGLEGFEIVRAPYLGTFYRAPKPGEASYVEIGSVVTAESELCLIEVMKLFTAVRAGAGGTVAHVFATDGQMVEAGQPLFAIDAKG